MSFVQIPFSNQEENIPYFQKAKFDYDLISKYSKQDIKNLTDIIDYQRKIILFDASSMLFKNTEDLIEDLILVENKVIHKNTPLAYDFIFQNIDLSYMTSYFIFSKPKFEDYRNNPKLYYLYGYSTGFGVNLRSNKYVDYGFSLFDMINNSENSKINNTCKFSPSIYLDKQCEFLGPIYPNIYTETHYEILKKEKYNKYYNKLDAEYYLKDLTDNDTYVERNRFKSFYINDFEPDEDFYTLQALEMIYYLFLYYEIDKLNIIYHSRKGINFKDLSRNELYKHREKNIIDLNEFRKEIERELKNMIIFYSSTSKVQSDYIVFISVNHYAYGFEVIEEKTGKKAELKIPKPEMLERIFTRFTLNNELYKHFSKLYNQMTIDKMFRIGYNGETIDENKLENENETWVESRQNIEDFGEIYYARKT